MFSHIETIQETRELQNTVIYNKNFTIPNKTIILKGIMRRFG